MIEIVILIFVVPILCISFFIMQQIVFGIDADLQEIKQALAMIWKKQQEDGGD